MPVTTFIAYDFEIAGTLPGNLEGVSGKPPPGHIVRWPGNPEDKTQQGAIWKTVVQTGIQQADRLLAFVDLPNANVGFEVGYGLGLGKAVGLARTREILAPWLSDPPLNGFLCLRLGTPKEIREAVASPADKWIQLTDPPAPGTGVLVLCPARTGAVYLEELPPEWNWRTLPDTGWDLHTLPTHLAGIGLVLWVVTPHDDGPSGRDGRENAALSVVAGYVAARTGIELKVLQARAARVVVDVVATQTPFGSVKEFCKHLDTIKAEWDAKHAPRPVGVTAVPTGPDRPRIDPLPADDWNIIPARFLGRQLQLSDSADAVEGLLHRARTGEAPTGGRAVKVIWVHGFGGMGKSWFLHRARLQAGATVRSIIVDWDSTVWRAPLVSEPRCAGDVFEVIAYRLAQTLDPTAADPYWSARDRVRHCGEQNRLLRSRFDGQLSLAAGPERPERERIDPVLRRLLENESLWSDDPAKRTRRLETLFRDTDRHQSVFAAWCHETARDADPAAIEPDRILAEGLQEALRQAAAKSPLLLLLDTCEVLSADLDRWLRRLLIPLCRDETPVLVLIGSRLIPDVAVPAGSREGWQEELPRDRFRPVAFAEAVRFSIEEIETALRTLPRPVTGDIGELAAQLHRITRGVPLAVRAVLDLHTDGDDDSVLGDLAKPDDDEPLEEGEAVRKVVGTVARRMLYHLAPERRPERVDDLRDIIALALLQRADETVLKHLWPGQRVRDRLRDLGGRYALLSGGDLHATVRHFLRRHWRDEDERPRIFDEVLADVERVVASLPPVPLLDGSPESLARRLMDVNLRAWREGDGVVAELAGLLVVAMVYEVGVEDTQELLKELPLQGASIEEAGRIWRPAGGPPAEPRAVIAWLRQTCETAPEWSDLERASLALIDGISSARRGMSVTDAIPVFEMLETAFNHFGSDHLPQQQRVGQALFDVANTLHPHVSKDTRWCSNVEVAYQRAITLGGGGATCRNNLGLLYQSHLNRHEDAEREYLAAIALDPKFAMPHNGLGNLYLDHLGRYQDAEREYLAAIALDPKLAAPHNGLGTLYQDYLCRYADAEREYLAAIPLNPKSGSGQRGLTWLCLIHTGDMARARRHAEEAMAVEPTHPGSPLAIIAVTTWDTHWSASRTQMPEWLAKCPSWLVAISRVRLAALVRKIREQGELPDLAEMLRAVEDRPHWKPWSEVVSAVTSGTVPAAWGSPEAERIHAALV